MDVRGRTAFITGASQGIGRLIALELARLGANLALAGPNLARLEVVVKECLALNKNVKAVAIKCDLAKVAQVQQAFEDTMKQLDHVTILVNSAYLGHTTSFEKVTEHELNDFYRVNVTGRFLATQQALKCFRSYFADQRRQQSNWKCPPLWIINIGSAWSNPRHAMMEKAHMLVATNLTAGAQNELTWSTASFLGDTQFGLKKECPDIDARCVQISPAVFDSGVTQNIAKGLGLSPEQFAQQFSTSKKLGDPQQVANLAAEIVSGKRNWANGEIYEIEGNGQVQNICEGDSYWAPKQAKTGAFKAPESRVAPPMAA